jgi:hypothetical protein
MQDLAVEAFSATTRIRVYSARWPLFNAGTLLAEATFRGSALEFGGRYRCARERPSGGTLAQLTEPQLELLSEF